VAGCLSSIEDFCCTSCSKVLCPESSSKIKSLNRYICEKVPNYTPQVAPFNNFNISIVGAGPTGLTCAHYLARLGYKVDIYEKNTDSTGILGWIKDSPRVPNSVLEREIQNLLLPTIEIHYGKSLGMNLTIEYLKNNYDSIFLACGLEGIEALNIDKQENNKMIHGISFLRKLRKNLLIIPDQTYMIIGRTYLAVYIAEKLIDLGALNVHIIANKTDMNNNVSAIELSRLKELGVNVYEESDEDKFISLKSRSKEIILADSDSQGLDSELKNYLNESLNIEMESLINPENMLLIEHHRIFAGGEMTRCSGGLIKAVRDGRKAALLINQKLRGFNSGL